MKKVLFILIAVTLAALCCLPAAAATNSNHLIDEGWPSFNKKETEWDVYGWTCVDTKITALGYKLDGADVVWVDETVDEREDAEVIKDNDCFEDATLELTINDMGLANGLEIFYAYRMHITLDTTEMAKGKHTFEAWVKYDDGTEGNPMRGTVLEIEKKKDTASTTAEETTAEQTTEEVTTAEVTTAEETTAAEATAAETTAAETTEAEATAAETTAAEATEAATKTEETTETVTAAEKDPAKSGVNPGIIVAICAGCAGVIAVVAAVILKMKKK